MGMKQRAEWNREATARMALAPYNRAQNGAPKKSNPIINPSEQLRQCCPCLLLPRAAIPVPNPHYSIQSLYSSHFPHPPHGTHQNPIARPSPQNPNHKLCPQLTASVKNEAFLACPSSKKLRMQFLTRSAKV